VLIVSRDYQFLRVFAMMAADWLLFKCHGDIFVAKETVKYGDRSVS